MKKQCPSCGGTGQIGFFQGVSRFLLSWEECPHCCGTGFLDRSESDQDKHREEVRKGGKRAGKGKK